MILIDEKYELLLGKCIYNKELDKHGYISSIEIMEYIGGWCINLVAYYDTFQSRDIIFLENFENGTLQFTIITDYEPIMKHYVEDIKAIFGEKFSEDMILYVSEEERSAKNREKDALNVKRLGNDLVDLDKISAEVMAEDFYSRELYLKYKGGVLTEEQLLYGIINHLSQELKRREDSNIEYFFKYELLPDTEEIFEDEFDDDEGAE